ncbi:AsmA family protein [Aromatoleum anaerobium]|uniref:AsmA family protein n=1 Tax=Aromatoleum anaerobium TaxID=182180 RepID=A0ABX1PL54_9RHOO|nr:AsmA family protein [Aromatoleum anaerobium]MCK0508781.1 AsmA family protein [Aromatoleum anaerobium]
MNSGRVLRGIGVTVLGLIALIVLAALLFDPNWLRGPIMRQATEKTGRELVINGELDIDWGWPVTRLSAGGVTFANPQWAEEPQMFTAENISVGVSLPQLFRRVVMLPEITLDHVDVFLEQHPDGRKNWLLDREQKDEGARVGIGRLALHDGRIRYADPAQKTRIDATLSTTGDGGASGERQRDSAAGSKPEADAPVVKATEGGIRFEAKGRYKGLPMNARGTGGPVLALRDEETPYPLDAQARFGDTLVKAEGSITSLLKLSAIDLDVDLRGASTADLYRLIGIALPETPPYRTAGHLIRNGNMWRYENFSGAIGKSDIAGTLQVATGGERPSLHGELSFKLLDFADLGPLVGAQETPAEAGDADADTGAPAADGTVLPETPFRTGRWNSVDADVKLRADRIRRPEALPIDKLVTRLQMQDSVLTLDPLEFALAGGTLNGTIRMNGQKKPLEASARLRVRNLKLAELFPTSERAKPSLGELNGQIDLSGRGNSVARMLGTADGKAALILSEGRISRFMVEALGLHLWDMLQLKLGGDELVEIRCLIADFGVTDGIMETNALVLDTDITRITGSGTIDLGEEKLDLTLKSDTKVTTPVALRGPIYIRGTFANPEPSVDTARVAARGLGAVALGLINPLLALIPLVETGPGMDSDCGQLIREAKSPPRK